MIKAIIFDVGGVMLRTESRDPRNAIEARHNLAPGESEIYVFNGEVGQKAQRGEVTIHALWQSIKDKLSLTDAELAQFKADFWGGDRMDYAMIDFIRSLQKNYKTAIISNAFDDLQDALHNDYQVTDAFDFITVSAIEGVMKPDAQIFESCLKRLQVAPEEAVFIDDFQHNIAGAAAVGIHGIHYTAGMDLAKALAELGVTP